MKLSAIHLFSSLLIISLSVSMAETQMGGDPQQYVLGTEKRSAKRIWPEVVGLSVEAAEKIIRKDKPQAHFQVVPPNTDVTMEYNPRRVRLFVNSAGTVAQPPIVG